MSPGPEGRNSRDLGLRVKSGESVRKRDRCFIVASQKTLTSYHTCDPHVPLYSVSTTRPLRTRVTTTMTASTLVIRSCPCFCRPRVPLSPHVQTPVGSPRIRSHIFDCPVSDEILCGRIPNLNRDTQGRGGVVRREPGRESSETNRND